MKELFGFLLSIKDVYRLYVGEGDLIALKHFIDGYCECLKQTNLLTDYDLYEQFYTFVEEKYSFDKSSGSIYHKIQIHSSSIAEAYRVFFTLLSNFYNVYL